MSRYHAPLARVTRRPVSSLQLLLRLGWGVALGIAYLAAATAARAQGADGVCRVTTIGTSGNDGSSWTQSTDLRFALANAACSEIWVAAGVYKPTTGADRAETFAIRSDVAVYGGFGGGESARDERDPALHRSVLSGDIDGNDSVDADGITASATDIVGDNSLTVVYFHAASTATVLDGFTISGGLAVVTHALGEDGGGVICIGVSGEVCAPTLRNLVIRGNAGVSGGGMLCAGVDGGRCGATLENVAFIANSGEQSGFGGALLNETLSNGISDPVLRNVTFSGNFSAGVASALANIDLGGATKPTLYNVTFSGNINDNGMGTGAVIANGSTDQTDSSASFVNVIVSGNTPDTILNQGIAPTFQHGILRGGCPADASCSDVADIDPLLLPLQYLGGATPVVLPGAGSAAIDSGTCDNAPATDQRGVARPQGAGCDLGAAEVRQAHLAVAVSGGGNVGAVGSPLPQGAAIADCRQGQGTCAAWYGVEPDATIVTLALHPDAGNVVQSASGCGGALGVGGFTFVTGALADDCSVSVVFAPPAHTIGGTVTGLAGSGLVLALNGDETLPIDADGRFTFIATALSGDVYAVTIDTQPSQPTQDCVVVNDSGTVGNSDVANVIVHCGAATTHSVGGALGGLAPGASITLLVNGSNALTLAANGSFAFAPRFAPGDGYLAQIAAQPDGQHCTLDHGQGTVGNVDVTTLNVDCQAGGANLQLSVTGEGDYARYGQVRKYIVRLANDGNGVANDVAIGAAMSAAFDEPNVRWTCIDGAPGATCTAQGEGGFADTATLPPGTSLTWIVRAPIRADSDADMATFTAHAGGAAPVSDADTLVIFRDGLDVPYAGGASATDPDVR